MKSITRIFLFIPFFLLILTSFSVAEDMQPSQKLLFHVSDKYNVPMLLKTIQQLYDTGRDPSSVKIVVLIQGHGVSQFVNLKSKQKPKKEIIKQITDLQKMGVIFEVCSFAMINQKISYDKLLPDVKHVPEGTLARLIELLEEGYFYIRI